MTDEEHKNMGYLLSQLHGNRLIANNQQVFIDKNEVGNALTMVYYVPNNNSYAWIISVIIIVLSLIIGLIILKTDKPKGAM